MNLNAYRVFESLLNRTKELKERADATGKKIKETLEACGYVKSAKEPVKDIETSEKEIENEQQTESSGTEESQEA